MSRANLDKQPHEVAEMFDDVAKGYDRANSVMTFGFDRRWRTMTARVLDARSGERVLDLAAGTGVSTVEYGRSGAWCVAADFSIGMLRRGAHRDVPMVGADAMNLPFADGSFDAVTVSFGLRNVHDARVAMREAYRVVRPGGRLVICECSTPPFAPIRLLYHKVLLRLLTQLAKRVASNRDAYTYLAESIRSWPDQRELAQLLADVGWREVAWLNLTFGVVALHHAVKPRPVAPTDS